MPFTDEHGNPIELPDLGISDPTEVKQGALRTIGKALPRAAAMTGGAEIGGALGALTPVPGGAEIGAAVGAGISNVAGRKLPTEMGGTPQESPLWAFVFGAGPEAVARGGASYLESRALARGGRAAHEAISKGLEEGPAAEESAAVLGQAMGRPTLRPRPIKTGQALTDETFALRDSIRGSIDQQRRTLGEPIGAAYDALKGNTNRLGEDEVKDLTEAAQGVKDSLIAPAPASASIFARIKRWAPEPPQAPEMIALPGGEMIQKPVGPPTKEAMDLMGMTPKQITEELARQEAKKPPTLDQLRELRQTVNQRLRSAKGGDVHALLNLQQAIDQHLMEYLPPDIGEQRAAYKGFIDRFPWRDINRLNQMGTPRELTQYVFGGTPERAHEIISGAEKGEVPNLKEALIDRVLSQVDPNAPAPNQVDAASKELRPYIANGTTKLLGFDDQTLKTVMYAPLHRERMLELWNQPKQQEAFAQAWKEIARTGSKDELHAAEVGADKLIQSLPPESQALFKQAPVPGAEMPALPSGQEALAEGLKPGEPVMGRYIQRRAQFAGPYAVSRLAMGGGGMAYGAANAATIMSIALGSKAYHAIMENGGAGALARLYSSPSGRAAARGVFEMLAGIGAQTIEQQINAGGPVSPPPASTPSPAPAR